MMPPLGLGTHKVAENVIFSNGFPLVTEPAGGLVFFFDADDATFSPRGLGCRIFSDDDVWSVPVWSALFPGAASLITMQEPFP